MDRIHLLTDYFITLFRHPFIHSFIRSFVRPFEYMSLQNV